MAREALIGVQLLAARRLSLGIRTSGRHLARLAGMSGNREESHERVRGNRHGKRAANPSRCQSNTAHSFVLQTAVLTEKAEFCSKAVRDYICRESIVSNRRRHSICRAFQELSVIARYPSRSSPPRRQQARRRG